MQITPIINDKSITVFPNGTPIIIRQDNRNFFALKRACKEKDWDKIEALSRPEQAIKKVVSQSTASSKIEIKNGQVYYEGYPLHNVVTQKILSILNTQSEDVAPWVKFVEKLMENPDRNSTEQLYGFLQYKELPLDLDGNVLGYKGVCDDFWSKHGNPKTVVMQGKVDSGGRIWNGVGETIEVRRNCVVNDPRKACAEGIHIGSFDYAKSWAGSNGRVLLVSFNPKDAVSVPSRETQKLRVCKYKVVADVTERGSEIGRACVDSSNNKSFDVSYDKEDLVDALIDFFYEYDSSLVTIELMREEGYIPYTWNVSEQAFAEAKKEAEQVIADTDDDWFPNMCVFSEREEEKQDPIEARIDNYINSKGSVTVRAIQSSLSGYANLSCKEIVDICEDMGFSIYRDGITAVSKWVVRDHC